MKWGRVFLVGGLVGMLASLVIIGSNMVLANPTEPEEVLHVTHEAWSYTVYRDSAGMLEGFVRPNGTDAAAIQAYGLASRRLSSVASDELDGGLLDVVVTFRKPISLERFEDVVANSGMVVDHYTLRAIGGNGKRWTIFGSPVDGQLVPSEIFESVVDYIREVTGSADVKGVISAEGGITTDGYRHLTAVSEVSLVDGLAAVARVEASRRLGVLPDAISMWVTSPFWHMEDVGVSNFQ